MTFSGNGFSLGSGGIEANLDGAVAGLGMAINLTADQTFTSNGTQWLMLKGNVALNGHTLTLTTNGTATNILMSDSGQFTGNGTIIKNGSASLEMRTDSTFTGQFIVDAGNVNVMAGNALGAIGAGNDTIVNGGLLRFNTVTTMTVPESITLNGGNISVVYNSGHVQFSGVVNLAAHASISNSSGVSLEFQNSINIGGFQLTVNVPSTLESITINGSINGVGKVIKSGVGNLIIGGSAASLYSGGTDILDGTITLQKTSGTSALGLGLITVGQTSTGSAKLIVNGHENISFFASCLVNLTGELSLPSSTTEVINNLTLNRGLVSVIGSTLSVFNFNVIGTTGNDSIVLSGTEAALTLSGAGTAAGILVRNAVAIDANVSNDTINAIAYSSLTKRTSLTGGDGNDTIFGSSAIDYIFAGLGNDNIDAGSGDDTVDGNDGNDTVVGGLGNDLIDFGTGSDLGLSTFDSDHFVSSTAFQALNVSSTDTISNMEIAAIYTVHRTISSTCLSLTASVLPTAARATTLSRARIRPTTSTAQQGLMSSMDKQVTTTSAAVTMATTSPDGSATIPSMVDSATKRWLPVTATISFSVVMATTILIWAMAMIRLMPARVPIGSSVARAMIPCWVDQGTIRCKVMTATTCCSAMTTTI